LLLLELLLLELLELLLLELLLLKLLLLELLLLELLLLLLQLQLIGGGRRLRPRDRLRRVASHGALACGRAVHERLRGVAGRGGGHRLWLLLL